MPSTRSNRTAAPSGEARAFLSQAPSNTTLPSATASVAGAAASTAHRAIESIARIAEAQAGRTGSADAVSFGFKMGDQSLTVRVEMRGGEVRAQFSTDSSEVRSAIASQWSSLSDGSADRSYQFSAPVFTTSDGRPTDAGSDTGGSQQEAPGQFTPASGSFAAVAEDAAESPSDSAGAAAPVTAQRLHTFA